jgi:hypothetical protein
MRNLIFRLFNRQYVGNRWMLLKIWNVDRTWDAYDGLKWQESTYRSRIPVREETEKRFENLIRNSEQFTHKKV